ncbi:MAG: Gfo/Idh/MocA family oxidoreductase [Actinobacteria bacterium]|nr:MAG: Gfo/Idh/MocA family oxidoreductase [Actinomycetota bacterium]
MGDTTDRVRIGCLGAARIAPAALVKPARANEEVEVTAVAARDAGRARAFADKQGIPVVHDSYDALLADPDVDAIYNPLPNGLHALWTIRALEAGKHVLCEKPFTANAAEAEQVATVADSTGLVVMEAFHWRYHPLATRMLDVVNGGELGQVRRIETWMCFPLFKRSDIRWQLDLAGGALMDAGCYAVHMLRTLAGAEPEVVAAEAKLRSPGVDRAMGAEMRFADGRTGRINTSMWSTAVLKMAARVEGDAGVLNVFNPVAPQYFHRFTVKVGGKTRREKVSGGSTYSYQLAAFAGAVLRGEPTLTPPTDSIATMRVIDDVYRAAEMAPRQGAVDTAA